MSLGNISTPAFLALWNDIDPSRTTEYERWHTLEHVPERVWAPGFVSGTRYVATRSGQPRYFTRYDLEDLSALATPAYRDLVDHPTPWSASMRPAFSHFLRKPCQGVALEGATQGAALLVMRLVWAEPIGCDAATRCAHQIRTQGEQDVVTRVTVGRVQTAGPQAMGNVDDAPEGDEWIYMIEATDSEQLATVEALARTVLSALAADPMTQHAGATTRHARPTPPHADPRVRQAHPDRLQARRFVSQPDRDPNAQPLWLAATH